MCRKNILGKYRAVSSGGYFYHLNCYWGYVNKTLEAFKLHRRKLAKYRNYMIVEKLQDG